MENRQNRRQNRTDQILDHSPADTAGLVPSPQPGIHIFFHHIFERLIPKILEKVFPAVIKRRGFCQAGIIAGRFFEIDLLIMESFFNCFEQLFTVFGIQQNQRSPFPVKELRIRFLYAPEVSDGDIGPGLREFLESTGITGGPEIGIIQETVHIIVHKPRTVTDKFPGTHAQTDTRTQLQSGWVPAFILHAEPETDNGILIFLRKIAQIAGKHQRRGDTVADKIHDIQVFIFFLTQE